MALDVSTVAKAYGVFLLHKRPLPFTVEATVGKDDELRSSFTLYVQFQAPGVVAVVEGGNRTVCAWYADTVLYCGTW